MMSWTSWGLAQSAGPTKTAAPSTTAAEPTEAAASTEAAAPTKTAQPAKPKKLNCSKGFLSLRTPPPACAELRQVEYALLPAIFSTKETSLGGAVYGELSYFTDMDPKTGVSRTGLGLTYTVRNQFIARAPVVVTFNQDDFIIDGTIDFRIYPNRYYGLGNDADWDYQQYRED
ncbi:MAG TPA: hypothetical protein VN764_07615, partial [Polyangiaceae bacterium]|nr:hypothetical protein [Polyangiaceae bacterium]